MPRDPKKEIQTLQQQLEEIQRKLRQARAAEKDQDRRNDTRRKIIGGGFTETHALKNPNSEWTKTYIRVLKESVLVKDRWLFEEIFRKLLPKNEAETLLAEVPPPPSRPQVGESDAVSAAE